MSLLRRIRTELAGACRSLRYDLARRPAVALTGLGALAVAGAAGAYLGVVNGMGSLLGEPSAVAGTVSAAPTATGTFTPDAGIGRGPSVVRPGSPRTTAAGVVTETGAQVEGPGPATTDPLKPGRNVSPIRTTKPAKTGSISTAPAPTPTAPRSSPTPAPPDSAGPSDPVSSSETAGEPSDSVEPSDYSDYRHHPRSS